MSRHDEQVSLRQILDHAREASDMARGRTREELDTNRMLQLALTRLMEIIGEAATRISLQTRQTRPEIPWPQIIGMRNRLVHAYDAVDLDILWAILQNDLSPLMEAIENLVREEEMPQSGERSSFG